MSFLRDSQQTNRQHPVIESGEVDADLTETLDQVVSFGPGGPVDLVDRLTVRLGQLSGTPLRWRMTPQLAYGRHRGPARMRSRRAAVAVCLMWHPTRGWIVPLTRRPNALRHHGGQICFPGGRIETNESPRQAAMREFEEELGLPAAVRCECGELPKQYVYASDNEVTPVVSVIAYPAVPWQPDPTEVDEVIELPLSAIIPPARIESQWQRKIIHSGIDAERTVGELRFAAPAFRHQDWRIWGATAVILDQVAQCLEPSQRR